MAAPSPVAVAVAIVGAGGRGTSHSRRVAAAGGRVVAVVDPIVERRERLARRIEETVGFRPATSADLGQVVGDDIVVDAAVVATPDADHAATCTVLAEAGIDILCEKPMSADLDGLDAIADVVHRTGVLFAVCHSLRYTPYTDRLLSVLRSGRIGRIVSVQHMEPVGWWHFAHSYVRGNWRRADTSGPLLLTKSSHDLDWLGYVIGVRPVRVSSFGALTHFRPENRPTGATDRCVDCAVEPDCPYSAVRLYTHRATDPAWDHWPRGAVADPPTPEALDRELRTGPYGRCVYDCDNDVVDHQVVALQYEDGVTATHTVTAFTAPERRRTRICGTHGELTGDGDAITVTDFRGAPDAAPQLVDGGDGGDRSPVGSHADGDQVLVAAFLEAVRTGDTRQIRSGLSESVASHRLVWAAETARLSGTVVEIGAQSDAR